MKVVLDTNVLLSASIASGLCADLLEESVRRHRLVTSEFILNELFEKLRTKLDYPAGLAREAIALLQERMAVVQPAEIPRDVCRDAADAAVIGTAVAGRCRCLVSGDKDLLAVGRYRGILILSPRQFWIRQVRRTHRR